MKLLFSSIFLFIFTFVNGQHVWKRTSPGGGGAIALTAATAPDANGKSTILVASDLSGIYRSFDNGVTFDVVGATQGLEDTHVSALGMDPNNPSTFFAGTYSYLYKTTDLGNSFTKVFPMAQNEYCYVEDVVIAKSNSQIGYVTYHAGPTSNGKVYKTTDGGNTWGPVANENLPNDIHIVKLLVHPMNADVVYALSGRARWGCGPANLYRSENGGVAWTRIGATEGEILDMDVAPNNPDAVYISTFKTHYENNAQCRDLTLDDYPFSTDDNNVNYTAFGEVYMSTNKGADFTQIGDVTGILSVGNDIVNNEPQTIRVVNSVFPFDWNDDAGIWETTNGGTSWTMTSDVETWRKGYVKNQYYSYTQSSNGLNKTAVKDIFNPDRFFGAFGTWAWASLTPGGPMDNITSIETPTGSDLWQSTGVENTIGTSLDVNDADPQIVYMGGYDIGFWFSLNGGESWRRRQPDYNNTAESFHLYTWDVGTPGAVPEDMAKRGAGGNIMNILSDPIRTNVVWASFSFGQYHDINGLESSKPGLFKSLNNGETWALSSGLPAHNVIQMMYGLSMDVNSGNANGENRTLYITANNKVYISDGTDGDSWTLLPNSPSDVKFTQVDKHNGTVYAGGKSGLFRSTDKGANWTKISTLAMESSNTNLYPDIIPTFIQWDGSTPAYLPWEGIFDIETDPNHADRLYVTVHAPNDIDYPGPIEGGLYRSNDAGQTWLPVLYKDSHMRSVSVAPANSDVIYLTSSKSYNSGGFGNSAGILYSTDGGANWNTANEGMAFKYAGAIEIETGNNPQVWTQSLGTGVQKAVIPFSILPVEYLSPFSARLQGNQVHLRWQTAEEIDADYFIIERSNNGRDWSNLATISANNRPSNYARIDQNPNRPISYYRLKQVDLDGRYTYSDIISIQISALAGKTNVYPNPTKGILNIDTDEIIESLELINMLGQIVKSQQYPIDNTWDIRSIQGGIYILKVHTTFSTTTIQLIIED